MAQPTRSKRNEIYKGPRDVEFSKTETGFGFNVRGQVGEGGQLKSINGVLYAPLQHVSAILEGGAAETAGVRPGDRILSVNGEGVEGATHKKVVELIKAGGDHLKMTVISVPARDFQRLDPDDDCFYDYTDVKRLDVSIPNYEHVDEENNRHVVYMVVLDGKMVAKRRYSEFLNLCEDLKKIFRDFQFPKFPGKWPFQLSEAQLEKRRYVLENYLQKTLCVRVIQECDTVLDFLNIDVYSGKNQEPNQDVDTHKYNPDIEIGNTEETSSKSSEDKLLNGTADQDNKENVEVNSSEPVVMKLLLPNRKKVELSNEELNDTAGNILKSYLNELEVDEKLHSLYSLFKFDEENIYLKLSNDECLSDSLSTPGNTLHFAVRKWLFNVEQENLLLGQNDDTAVLLTGQAYTDVKSGIISVSAKMGPQLKLFATQNNHQDFLELVRKSSDYSSVSFPHCACDSRKRGHVTCKISFDNFKLFACTEDGVMESQVIDFSWLEMKEWQITEDGHFQFQYERGNKKPRWVTIQSKFSSYMNECFSRVLEERKWISQIENGEKLSKENIFVANKEANDEE